MSDGCKVERVTEKYSLADLDRRILRRRDLEDASLRELETFVSERLLRRAMVEADMRILDGEAANFYRLLTDDGVLRVDRRQARWEFETAGVDVDGVLEDVPSYKTIQKHLQDCLGRETGTPYTPRPGRDIERIELLEGRVRLVVGTTIERLRRHGALQVSDPEVTVSVTVRYGCCDRVHRAEGLIAEQSCPRTESELGEEEVGAVK